MCSTFVAMLILSVCYEIHTPKMGALSAQLLPGIFAPFQNTAIALLLGYCCVEVSNVILWVEDSH